MSKHQEFERQRLLAERLADEYGIELLRLLVSRLNDPEVVAGVYCQVFQEVFEDGLKRKQRKARSHNSLGWLQTLAEQQLARPEDELPKMAVEEDLVAALAGVARGEQLDAVPPSLLVRNLQFIRASVARAQANLHHRGPFWLKAAITLTIVLAIAAVVWGGWSYMKIYAGPASVQAASQQFSLNMGEPGTHE